MRAERAISCVLRGSVWLADEKVRLAGGDKRGLITASHDGWAAVAANAVEAVQGHF